MQICKICNSNLLNNSGEIEGYRSGSYFTIYECKNCGVSYTDPCVADEKIYESIYKQVESVPGYSRYYELANAILNKKNPLKFIGNSEENYYSIIKYLEENIGDKGSVEICELGCGQGYLTYALAKSGYRITGVDISKEAIGLAERRYGNHYFCGSLVEYLSKNKKPKYIIASELIEHLSNPKDFFDKILKCIDFDIKIILTTPQKFFDTNLLWDTELPPVHLWWFTKNSLIDFAKSINCDVNFINTSEFFYENKKYTTQKINSTDKRMPIFDEKYNLINPLPKHSKYQEFKKILKSIMPNYIIEKYQYFSAMKANKILMTNENSNTLCFVLERIK